MRLERSISAFARARGIIAGGVNSPVRAFRAVGGSPVFMRSGSGASLCDIDGHEYIDYVLSWGPMLLGHAHPAVVKAVTQAAQRGSSFGTPTEAESEFGELIRSMMPGDRTHPLHIQRHRGNDERRTSSARNHGARKDR